MMKKIISILTALVMTAAVIFGAGIITVSGLPGDTNEDGAIDNKDVVTLFRYVSGTEKAEDESKYDYNKDGVVDNKDVVALFRAVSTGSVSVEETTEEETTEDLGEFTVEPDPDAELHIPMVFGDHMVIQRDAEIKVWGTSNKDGAQVRGTFMDESARAKVKDGKWEITFSPKEATFDPQTLTVEDSCGNVITFSDILVGDVWMIGGQSNAEATSRDIPEPKRYIITNESKPLRLFHQGANDVIYNKDKAAEPCDDLITTERGWRIPDYDSAEYFSLLGWFLGDRLCAESGVPIGVISIAASGATISELMPKELADQFGYTKGGAVGVSKYYNGLINPFLKMKFTAMVFFQGESESFRGADPAPKNYARDFEALMTELRSRWGFDFPIYNIQLSDYTAKAETEYPYAINVSYVRAQQYNAYKKMSGVRLIPSYDLGAREGYANFLHSPYKKELAERVADLVLAEIYGVGSVDAALAPEPEKITVVSSTEDQKVIEIKFKNVGDGLRSSGGSDTVTGFAYGRTIQPNSLTATTGKIISSDTVQLTVSAKCTYVGYANISHVEKGTAQLYNSYGLPALAFHLSVK